jgi:DNA-binding protein YbaB
MFGNMKEMMGKLQDAQQESKAMKQRLAQIELREENAGLTIVANGNKEIKDIRISPELFTNKEELANKLILGINRALEKAQASHDLEMQSMAKSMFK